MAVIPHTSNIKKQNLTTKENHNRIVPCCGSYISILADATRQ